MPGQYGAVDEKQSLVQYNAQHDNTRESVDQRFVHSGLQDTEAVEGVPLYPDATSREAGRFIKTGYRDVWAMILFVLLIFVTAGIGAHNASDMKSGDFDVSDDGEHTLKAFRIWVPAALATGVAVAFLTLAAMRAFARQFIIIANVFVILLNLAIAIIAFMEGVIAMGVLWLLCCLLQAAWLYLVRYRIPFATVLLRTSVTLVARHYGTIISSFFGLLAAAVYFGLWLLMGAPIYDRLAEDNGSEIEAWQIFAALGLLLALLWATQVFTNIVHVTSSGVVATWYFLGEMSMPANPTVASGKRAMTTSLGSICFGSLIVAILKLIYYMARSAARNSNNDFAACIAACILGCLERLMEYFNVYAFTHVAIYGSSYIEAAKQTWNLVKECGWAAYFNDCLVWPVLALTTFFPAAAVGVGFGLAAWNVLVGVVCFLMVYVIMALFLRPVYSGIVTQFVCVAECPDVMQSANPAYFAAIEEATASMAINPC
jgi:hypothetical protein